MESKKELRRLMSAAKKAHSASSLETLSQQVLASLECHPAFIEANTVLLYHSLPDEVATWQFVDKWSQQKRIVLPVVVGDDLELRPYGGQSSMAPGAYGILEPVTPLFTDYDSIDLAVVPGVAFTADGCRLGRGKGYYDRLLPRLKATKLGLCFPFQIVPHIPCDEHDVLMDAVVTAQK
jgi:5-formyltetrahydrofolate cyclo-ligase